MNFATLLTAVAKKQFFPTPHAPKPPRTKTPLRASQESGVVISVVPMILANSKGAMFGQMPTNHTVEAVGTYSLAGSDPTLQSVTYYNIYLSSLPGGFLRLGLIGSSIAETRLYRVYTEVTPASVDDWNFWLDNEGYIGEPVAKSLDADGAIPFNRSWGKGPDRIRPFTPSEVVLAKNGETTRLNHQMMHYSRRLADAPSPIAEHLLVSAIAENSTIPSGVTFWLGIDLDPSEVTVYPAADAPVYP